MASQDTKGRQRDSGEVESTVTGSSARTLISTLPRDGLLVTLSELREWGELFGRSSVSPWVVALSGDLGAGKTTLAQAFCRGVGILEDVTSPTFSLVNSYEVNGGTLFHLDLYRIEGPSDLTNLGWEEIVNSGDRVIVEWPERAAQRLPVDALRLHLAHVAEDSNRRRLTALL